MRAKKRNRRNPVWVILLLLSILLIAVSIGVAAWVYTTDGPDLSKYQSEPAQTAATAPTQSSEPEADTPTAVTPTTEPTVPTLAKNPIDFAGLQELNPDVYAWISIPDTNVDLPVLQSDLEKSDNYYINHNVEGDYAFKGCIYSQRANSKDFSDPVTVLYGHNMLDGSMFSNLHNFRDKTFFEENDCFYIYMPGHILTYEIVSAHRYDTRHILNSFDFSKPEVFQEYIDYILSPKTMVANVREGAVVTTDDRIVTLSTCMESGTARYLVQGVLVNDEPTE